MNMHTVMHLAKNVLCTSTRLLVISHMRASINMGLAVVTVIQMDTCMIINMIHIPIPAQIKITVSTSMVLVASTTINTIRSITIKRISTSMIMRIQTNRTIIKSMHMVQTANTVTVTNTITPKLIRTIITSMIRLKALKLKDKIRKCTRMMVMITMITAHTRMKTCMEYFCTYWLMLWAAWQ
jgi:hypothetical protein